MERLLALCPAVYEVSAAVKLHESLRIAGDRDGKVLGVGHHPHKKASANGLRYSGFGAEREPKVAIHFAWTTILAPEGRIISDTGFVKVLVKARCNETNDSSRAGQVRHTCISFENLSDGQSWRHVPPAEHELGPLSYRRLPKGGKTRSEMPSVSPSPRNSPSCRFTSTNAVPVSSFRFNKRSSQPRSKSPNAHAMKPYAINTNATRALGHQPSLSPNLKTRYLPQPPNNNPLPVLLKRSACNS